MAKKVKEELELSNVRVRVQVSKTVQVPKFEPYQVQMSVEADIDASAMADVEEAFGQMFTKVHEVVMDGADAYLESVR